MIIPKPIKELQCLGDVLLRGMDGSARRPPSQGQIVDPFEMVPGSELPYRIGDLRVGYRAQLLFDPPLEVGKVFVAGRQDLVVLQDCA
ncbi:hypothetical protein [Mycobacteroides abscessus]|uniref:hypothetical protein n=1 Tax=Mycobacteroides abscessus TaxID=36809 RepID=UPI0028BE81B0|nr:hypothetical protein [Mycobacteroides abscessus]